MNNTFDILYVEDNDVTVELFQFYLDRYSTEITLSIDVAGTVAEAKDLFCPSKHVAALIDWNLPDGKGTDAARYIRSQNPTTPIIFLSALFTPNIIEEANKFSHSECLEKEFTKEFVARITRNIQGQ